MHIWQRLKTLVQTELRHLTTINPSNRRWQMPVAAALATGLPLMVGAYFGHMDYGLVSSLGGLVFLYAPNTPLSHRMVWLMACGFGMAACYALGVMGHFFPAMLMWVITFIAILVTMVCRFYRVGPPGSLFFVMAAAIGAYSPGDVQAIPLKVGLLTMGALLACLIAFFYSLHALRLDAPQPVSPLPPPTFDFVVFDAVVIGAFVGISLALAQVLQLERPYWVPVSCLAVIQGATLRAVWNRQLQRVLGTGIGLLLSWALLMLPLNEWGISLMMIALAFVIESMVVRHYGIAVIFITPLTLFLAEAATLGQGSPAALIEARFLDTLLGCVVGLAGAVCLHDPRFRTVVGTQLRRLTPTRLMR
ncbi:FUSC family protein [Thauera sinica]|uniref:FUSC family protein n=1 Tax=Thauera sinica TaxID=2665146 RepID=A0ABW1AP16_9RHOO|nr:FUSC family protein [Thauera sp. K11]ATE61975.1 hypothetical protein CCZ27_20160 [Thauera sp. K11]